MGIMSAHVEADCSTVTCHFAVWTSAGQSCRIAASAVVASRTAQNTKLGKYASISERVPRKNDLLQGSEKTEPKLSGITQQATASPLAGEARAVWGVQGPRQQCAGVWVLCGAAGLPEEG